MKKLNRHVDERGYLMEILRHDDELFIKFGQVYISVCFPGIVKAWHAHRYQYDNFCVIKGNAKIGLYDGREDSETYGETSAIIMGELNPLLLQIPPMVWHGQMAIGGEPSILLNIPTELYNYNEPDELRREPFDKSIPFEWFPKSR